MLTSVDISGKVVIMEDPAQEVDDVFASSCLFTILRSHHHCPTGQVGWRVRIRSDVEINIQSFIFGNLIYSHVLPGISDIIFFEVVSQILKANL